MTVVLADTLLVSSVNDGGVFLLEDGAVERLSTIDTTGMATAPDGILWARQSPDVAELRVLAGRDAKRIALAQAPWDLHDVHWHDGHAYAVATEINAILKLDAGLAEVERWTLPGEPDSAHVNSVCMHHGRLLATRFGTFETRRGYKGMTRGAGEVFDVRTGEVVVSGLSQPHSLCSVDGRLWLCDSEAYTVRVYRDFVAEAEYVFDGYVRGLAFGASHAYVGLSRSRNDPDGTLASAQVVVLRRHGMVPVARVPLPTGEIYDLRIVSTDPRDLRAAALAEANAEIDAVIHARNLAAADAHRAFGHVDRISRELHVLHGRATESDATTAHLHEVLGATRGELHDAIAQGREHAAWAEMLESENKRLRQFVEDHETYVARQAEALHALRDYADTVVGSRSWRYTRPLRRIEPVPPAPFELPFAASGHAPPDRSGLPVFGLAFETHEIPVVSIVVTAYGRFEETLACLHAIRRSGTAIAYEVILIEDASDEREMARFGTVPGLRYHANAENLGFLGSANQALALAGGEYVHFLNNDTLVQPGWLDALLRTFTTFHDCGMAGSKLVYPDGRLQEAGGIVWSDADACNHGKGDAADRSPYGYTHEADYVSGASLLLRTEVLRALGGFDGVFAPAYYEDTDLAFRVRQAGWKVYLQPGSVVVHHEGLSHGTDVGVGLKTHQARNRETFLARWRDELERDQMPPGEHVFLAKDRAQRRKSVLFVDRHPPRVEHDAGSRAIWQLLRVLHLQGFSLKFWAHEADGDATYARLLQAHGIELIEGHGPEAFEAWLSTHGAYIDHAVLSRPMIAADYIDALQRHSAAVTVYYGHDIHFQRIDRQFALTGESWLHVHARHLQAVEEDLWRKADLVLYPSQEETRHVAGWLQGADAGEGRGARAETIPLFAYEAVPEVPDRDGSRPGERRNIVFVGGFAHAPNEDGVLWFVREVWPRVHHAHPHHRLCLIGSNPTPDVLALAAADVLVTGHLPEHALVDYYHSARVVVAPLRYGAGTKGKVIEAMYHGVPCVTTTTGAQGLGDAAFLRVADNVEGMAADIDALIRDDEVWWEAARASQAYVRERFSVDSVWQVLAKTLDPSPYPDVQSRLAHLRRTVGGPPSGRSPTSPPD